MRIFLNVRAVSPVRRPEFADFRRVTFLTSDIDLRNQFVVDRFSLTVVFLFVLSFPRIRDI